MLSNLRLQKIVKAVEQDDFDDFQICLEEYTVECV